MCVILVHSFISWFLSLVCNFGFDSGLPWAFCVCCDVDLVDIVWCPFVGFMRLPGLVWGFGFCRACWDFLQLCLLLRVDCFLFGFVDSGFPLSGLLTLGCFA